MRRIFSPVGVLCVIVSLLSLVALDVHPAGLSIETSSNGKRYLVYDDSPLFAFGPGDEFRHIAGMADLHRWARWQREHGMNLLRAYPLSMPGSTWGGDGEGLHPFHSRNGKWDVDAFNDSYFEHLSQVAKVLEQYGIILHLQLWQIVCFKGGSDRWNANYLNPANNLNEWTRSFSRGHQYIDAPSESRAREHQKEWVLRILDALKGRGNVIVDVINELGNEMGTLEWASDVVGWIRQWERENDWKFIVGVDSEHHYAPGQFEPYQDMFDIIILNELRSYEFARSVIERLRMPAVSVRSSDGRNRWEDYLFANDAQVGAEHQTRYRTLCYRSLFAGLQAVGAYWKCTVDQADYLDMQYFPQYALALRAFWNTLSSRWHELLPDDSLVVEAITPHAYALRSESLATVYLECGSHTWNNRYPSSRLILRRPFAQCSVTLFDTKNGEMYNLESEQTDDALQISLPEFTDDVIVLIHAEE